MPAIEFQTQINAPPEKVFAYVSDLEKHTEWTHGQAIRKTSEGPVAVGSTYQSQEKGPMGRTVTEKVEVTEYQPTQRFAWRSYGPMGAHLDWSFELRSQDSGTLLIQRFELSSGLLTTILGALFVNRQMRKGVPEGLAKIKEKLEAS
jgi:uncharacterized protein YndB with AHSA1/START domain